MALTTLASVKAQAGITGTNATRDASLTSLIAGVTALVKQKLNRDIESTSYTEYYSGDGNPILILRQYPVISITRICIDGGGAFGQADGAFPETEDLVEGTDFALMSGRNGVGGNGMVRRIGGVWPGRPYREIGTVENLPSVPSGNILVEYVAGYTVIPADIVMAVNQLVIQSFVQQSAGGGGVSSAQYEDVSASWFNPNDAAKAIGSITNILSGRKSIAV